MGNRKPSDFIRQGWSRGAGAQDRDGNPVDPTDPKAVKWDIRGAITAAYPLNKATQDLVQAKIIKAIAERDNVGFLFAYNDVHWMSVELIAEILEQAGE